MDVLNPTRLVWVSAIVPLLAFSGAHYSILSPELPEWAAPPAAEMVEPLPPPFYLPLDVPVRAGIRGGNTQIVVGIAVVARLQGPDLLTVSGVVTEKKETILADLTEILNQTATKNADPAHLYQVLPEQFRDAINTGLAIEAIPEPVEKVLIVELMVQGS